MAQDDGTEEPGAHARGHLKFAEKVGDSKWWAGWARVASVFSTFVGTVALAVIGYQAVSVIEATNQNAAALHRIDLFVQQAQDQNAAHDKEIDAINGDLTGVHRDIASLRATQADQNSRLRCLENKTICPQ